MYLPKAFVIAINIDIKKDNIYFQTLFDPLSLSSYWKWLNNSTIARVIHTRNNVIIIDINKWKNLSVCE